ncbi:MAG TPA: YigZ family protein [Psychromonas hadalis]|nr:YigZ family protein [Psychromonas hadalis]
MSSKSSNQQPEAYFILKENIIFEEEIKKSTFITYLTHIQGKEEALAYLQSIRELHPKARHHCWAYIGSSPKNDIDIGSGDDGEPKGTAGKPILACLQGLDIGEVVAVVVRYFGGIKLGTGGLVRAYSSGVSQLSKQITTKEKRFYQQFKLQCNYAQMAVIERLLSILSGRIVEAQYLQTVEVIVEVDQENALSFTTQLESQTQGFVVAKKHS